MVLADLCQTGKITADPTDNKFLACALEVKADYIVSGDNHLLEVMLNYCDPCCGLILSMLGFIDFLSALSFSRGWVF